MGNSNRDYLAYLLRLRRYEGVEEVIWRISLEEPESGQVHRFANLDEAMAFLRDKIQGGEGDVRDV